MLYLTLFEESLDNFFFVFLSYFYFVISIAAKLTFA